MPESSLTTTRRPQPSQAPEPSGPGAQPSAAPSSMPRRRTLTSTTVPRWVTPAVLAGSAVVAAAVVTGVVPDFSIAIWLILTVLLSVSVTFLVTRRIAGKRRAVDTLWRHLVWSAFGLALIPLVSVIWSVTADGIQGITEWTFWSQDMSQNASQSRERQIHEGERPMGGGVLHAIIGSLMVTLVATVISVPIGLLTSIYIVEYSRGGLLSRGITFFVDVMTGIPSIVAGLFGAAAVQMVLGLGNQAGLWTYGPGNYRMGLTASVALCVLMIPVVVRTTEEMLRVVPHELREASYALGVRKWRTILKVVIPTAISGIAAGVTLAIARVIGETAPILLTAGMLTRVNWNMLNDAVMTLPVYIYWTFTHPVGVGELSYLSEQRAWGAALVLIMIVMLLNLVARLIATFFAPKKSGR